MYLAGIFYAWSRTEFVYEFVVNAIDSVWVEQPLLAVVIRLSRKTQKGEHDNKINARLC